MIKNIAILGSTGSIGTQALEVIEHHPERLQVEILTANNNSELLIQQALKFKPNAVVIANESKYSELSEALKNEPIKVFAGNKAISQIVETENIDIVLAAMVGFAGLVPTYNAIKAGKDIALANKETLVVAGHLITNLSREKEVSIFPVDSEHSAIFQCLVGEYMNPIEKIYLTCSGGPFRGKTPEELQNVTFKDALNHPNWNMGNKITIDSATLINKGFEVIEAHWLFGLPAEKIDVIVHPQSIIHSIVQFADGSMKAQMGLPDMKLPIQYALSFPERFPTTFPRFNFIDYPSLDFEPPNTKIFRNLALSYKALETGGNMPCILNAANEVVVNAFLKGEIKFPDMPGLIEEAMGKSEFIENPGMEETIDSDIKTRRITELLVKDKK
ncbi:MAG: 1-deoxy-D-xylulose-5-phosphate reductoisomerase [Prolixibacteraceae bacterium]|nr:1-deoxy-D-xylulose-5-phosphate reductoisomerase [Prolixibacteraceae bacterium]MBN2774173.1 1-deoxy-D-xylulose-5-phosphate reductoisomerase [Prolixibacteraceae bacterium]